MSSPVSRKDASAVAALLFGFTFAATPQSDQVSVTVLPDDPRVFSIERPQLQFGAVSFYDPQSRRRGDSRSGSSFTVTRSVQLRAIGPGGAPNRLTLKAYLLRDCSPYRLRIDGIELGPAPAVIARDVQTNSNTVHRVELEIPVSAPPGAVDAEIVWQVE